MVTTSRFSRVENEQLLVIPCRLPAVDGPAGKSLIYKPGLPFNVCNAADLYETTSSATKISF